MSSSDESDSDIEFINNIKTRKQRNFKERINFLESLDDVNFLRRFRISKQSFRVLLQKIHDQIAPTTAR